MILLKRLRRLSFAPILLLILLSLILLLNITAPNPTLRRYSSQPVIATGDSARIGLSGERILSLDLGVPRNDTADTVQCVCNPRYEGQAAPTGCDVCVGYSETITNHRRPDFVTDSYIADSKNKRQLLVTDEHDYPQMREISQAALNIGVPFWIYVRVDTRVDDAYLEMTRATGGDVVYYFTHNAITYIDPVDRFAINLLIVSLVLLGLLILWEMIWRYQVWRSQRIQPDTIVIEPEPPHPVNRAINKTQSAEDFMRRTEEQKRRDIDRDDFWDT